MDTKICSKCHKTKYLTKFTRDKNRKDGRYPYCKECRKENDKRYRESGRHNENCKKYNKTEKGKETLRKAVSTYRKTEKYRSSWIKTNRKKRISSAISARMRQSLNGCKYNRHWEELVGYTLKDLKAHLQYLFKPGMSWKNYGKWHIDHKRPINSFNIYSYKCDDFRDCWKLENLQPLWARENLRKGAKYEIE